MQYKIPLIFQALLLQLLALLVLAAAVYGLAFFVPPPYEDINLVVAQAILATLLSFHLPKWWRIIQFLLPILLWLGVLLFASLALNPAWSLLVFVLLWLVFRNTLRDRVPLYLTNSTTKQALAEIVAEFAAKNHSVKFVDLGCGIGTNLGFVASLPSVEKSLGVETAWASYLVAKIRGYFNRSEVLRQDLWSLDLAGFNLVYAFLSPEPMAKLGSKILAEMPAGSVFVSNSFPIPDLVAEVWELGDKRQTELFIYRLDDLRAQLAAEDSLQQEIEKLAVPNEELAGKDAE